MQTHIYFAFFFCILGRFAFFAGRLDFFDILHMFFCIFLHILRLPFLAPPGNGALCQTTFQPVVTRALVSYLYVWGIWPNEKQSVNHSCFLHFFCNTPIVLFLMHSDCCGVAIQHLSHGVSWNKRKDRSASPTVTRSLHPKAAFLFCQAVKKIVRWK